jgi:hypothetical protein
MGKYDELLKAHEDRVVDDDLLFANALAAIQEMAADTSDTAELYRNAGSILTEIDEQFMAATKLDRTDVAFLMLATALQVCRWIVIGKINRAVSEKISDSRTEHNDKRILDKEKEKRDAYRAKHGTENIEGKHRDWVNIIYNGVPYDITKGSPLFGVNMGGQYHRLHTLGHDPVLGWIFGTMNILSDTITLDDFRTFTVCMKHQQKRWTGPTTLLYGFEQAYDSIREDSKRLPAALFAQALHLKSDVSTKLGLPIPILEVVNIDFAGKVYKEGYDSLLLLKDVAVIGIQAVASILMNMLIAALHGLFYDSNRCPNRDLYEVKTRKILSISNAIATSSNLIWVGGNAWLGNETAWKDFDFGGILVTVYRLVSDTKFISRIKKEYLESEWQKKVVGEEYSFITEANVMSKKDIKKGIEIQARVDAAKHDKVTMGLEKQADTLRAIASEQREVQDAVGVVLHDKVVEEAKELYGIGLTKSPRELGSIERQALCATLYTLMDCYGQSSDYQRAFYLNLERYLDVNKRITDFDFDKLNNIDSHSDRKVMLKVICAFLSMGDLTFAFKNDSENFGWLSAFTSQKDVDSVCEKIQKEISVLGSEGIVNRYKEIEAPSSNFVIEAKPIENILASTDTPIISVNYTDLKRIIETYLSDESSFGKKLKSLPSSLLKELKKTFPRLNPETIIFGTKIGNGYLLFSTYAMYVKDGVGLKSKYLRIPYKNIIIDRLATATGKVKGTRKLLISYIDEDSAEKMLSIDNTKITEERLLALLKEIIVSESQTAETDFTITLPEMSIEDQLLYFKALGNILLRDSRNLTELYLIVKDYGLEKRWNEIASAFADNDALSSYIQAFTDKIPYPSEKQISHQAILLALETLFRTNYLEGKETSLLSSETETLIRLFIIDESDENQFNDIIKLASESNRRPNLQTCFDMEERLPKEILYREQISEGLDVLIRDLELAILQKKKSFAETIKDVAQTIPENAEKVRDSAGRFVKSLRKNRKKETLTLPPQYQRIKQKLPEDIGVPKNAIGYEMSTEAASCLLISCPATEKASMPFDNPQQVIDELHEVMGENEGLIEVVNGTTSSGKPYIYNIIKHRIVVDDDVSHGVEYTLNINVHTDNSIQFINGSFSEEGTTGVRDSFGMALYSRVKNLNLENTIKEWFQDPYDSEFKKGFLMNFSERSEFDEQFPHHPLSEARALVRFIVENN